jgi:hypothetical protein
MGVLPSESCLQNVMQLAQRFGSFDFDLTPDRRIDMLKRHIEGEALERLWHLISGERESALLLP